MTYLEKLMLRLAQGTARLPEELRQRITAYVRAAQRADGGFAGREGESDVYYTAFGLRSLALLGQLDGEPAERAAAFLRRQLAGQAPLVDFLSLLFAAALLKAAADIDVFSQSPAGWRQSVLELFEQFRRPDGGYAKTDDGQSSSTYHTFLIVVAQELLGQAPIDAAKLIGLVRSRRRADGGFVEIGPMRTSGTNPTAAAAGLLTILNAFDDDLRDGIAGFLLARQNDEGGLKANPPIPLADLLSTFTGLLTLDDLSRLGQVDCQAALRFVRSLEDGGGFRAGAWDNRPDVEYTFYGFGTLALLA